MSPSCASSHGSESTVQMPSSRVWQARSGLRVPGLSGAFALPLGAALTAGGLSAALESQDALMLAAIAADRGGAPFDDTSLTEDYDYEDTDDDGPRRVVQDTLRRPVNDGDYQRQLHFGGRIYELTLAPTPAYLQQQRGWQSWTVLTCGLLLTGLLGALLLLVSGARAAVEARVQDRTARLRDREARLEAILDNAADAILTVDANGMVVSANAATARLFGYPRAIGHGMFSAARCVDLLCRDLPACSPLQIDLRFKRPLLIPGEVALHIRQEANSTRFVLNVLPQGEPHIEGALRRL